MKMISKKNGITPQQLLSRLRETDSFDYGLCAPPISDKEGLDVLFEHFLGKDYYCVMPQSRRQCNTQMICEILYRYPRQKY